MPLTPHEAAQLKADFARAIDRITTGKPSVGDVVTAVAKQPHDPNDPQVKLQPRAWKGESQVGKRYSECPPTFLGQLAAMLDSFADKSELDTDPQRQRYAKWDRENAATARRWKSQLEAKSADMFTGDDVSNLADSGAF